MASVTIQFPNMDTITAIMTILAFAWTIYQEYRHKHNNGTIKPKKSVIIINSDLEKIKDALHNTLPHFKK